jgi:hypothetical protein
LAVQADPLARLLGPAWQSMGYGTLADRAARFARTLTRYMGEIEVETAGEALEQLKAANAYRPGESFSSA